MGTYHNIIATAALERVSSNTQTPADCPPRLPTQSQTEYTEPFEGER